MFGRHISVNLRCCKCLCELCTLGLTLHRVVFEQQEEGNDKEHVEFSSWLTEMKRLVSLNVCVFYGSVIITVVSFFLSGPRHSPSLPSDGTHSRQGETSDTLEFSRMEIMLASVVRRHFLLLYLHNECQFFYNSRMSVVKFHTTPTRYLIITTIMLIPFLTC